jgi:hypothetical protein
VKVLVSAVLVLTAAAVAASLPELAHYYRLRELY